MSSKAGLGALVVLASVTTACSPGRDPQFASQDGRTGQPQASQSPREGRALRSLGVIEGYQVGRESYLAFRQDGWPAASILHMDVRSGPVGSADAVVIIGVAGGDPATQEAGDAMVEEVLAIIDDRGLCIVRGLLNGERYVAALPAECPAPVRAELDGILGNFDAMTGGDARWILRFDDGILQSKSPL